MLVDAGTSESEPSLIAKLTALGLKRLDLVAATHPHADHIGGMADVLDNFAVDTFIMPEISHTSATFDGMLDAIDRNGCAAEYAAAGDSFTLGAARVEVLSPDAATLQKGDLNNASLVLRVTYAGQALLLMGDAEAPVERALAADGVKPAAVLKAGHHGSDTSTTADFLAAVNPDFVVISAGAGNDYGHPSPDVLARLSGRAVFRTDLLGDVRADVADAGEVTVYADPIRP
jgi:beta-lactamase superfamily II metal-dependent hydrolase